MGLFNYIKIDKNIKLPKFPKELDRKTVNFQTKDLDENAMLQFRVTRDLTLQLFRQEGEWVENPEIKFFGSEFRVDNEWWEDYDFTGKIHFYESYKHVEDVNYSMDDPDFFRFERGWIEYVAKFVNGKMVDFVLFKITPPVKRTDDEIAKIENERIEFQKDMDEKNRRNRKEHPTREQKLIDNIYEEIMINWTIPTIEDYGRSLNKIREKIDEYRKKYDIYYERT